MTRSDRHKRHVERHQTQAAINTAENVKAAWLNQNLPDARVSTHIDIPAEVLASVTHNQLPAKPIAAPTRKKIFGIF